MIALLIIFYALFQDNPTLDRRIDTAQMGLGVVYKLTELLGGDLTAEEAIKVQYLDYLSLEIGRSLTANVG